MDRPSKRAKLVDASSPDPAEIPALASGSNHNDSTSQDLDTRIVQDLYLETVNRQNLDFDQEKICSVSLTDLNVYACLVCGKYFAGRSKSTPAYYHALEVDHHVFLNLSTLKAYILPDLYENKNPTLEDVKYAVSPTYSPTDVKSLDKDTTIRYDLSRTPYSPGFVGMNSSKGGDHIVVVIHALAHVAPLRNYFLLENLSSKSPLIQSFSLLLRKLWSARLLKSHISPHEFIRRASPNFQESLKRRPSRPRNAMTEPQEFMTFLMNAIHLELSPSKKATRGDSIVSACFQGDLTIETQKIHSERDIISDRLRFAGDANITRASTTFMFLTLALPPTPLFQNEVQRNVIPQVSLMELLARYNGSQVQECQGSRRRYRITRLPRFLMLHVKRFTYSSFTAEKNPTIVNFPLKSLDLSSFLQGDEEAGGSGKKEEGEGMVFDLLVNVSHESVFSSLGDESHVYRTQVRDKASDRWIQMEGLFVQEIKKDVISIGETVLQIWERRKVGSGGGG